MAWTPITANSYPVPGLRAKVRWSSVIWTTKVSLAFVLTTPTLAMAADQFNTPLASITCLRSRAYCAKNFAVARNTGYSNICVLDTNLCRASRSGDWREFRIARFVVHHKVLLR
jgi:hypothetical protein